MKKKKNYKVICHYNEEGLTLQEVIEKYFSIYFKEELHKMEAYDEPRI